MSYFDRKKQIEERFRQETQQKVIEAIRRNDRLTTRELADMFGPTHATIATWLDQAGYKKRFGRWVKKG